MVMDTRCFPALATWEKLKPNQDAVEMTYFSYPGSTQTTQLLPVCLENEIPIVSWPNREAWESIRNDPSQVYEQQRRCSEPAKNCGGEVLSATSYITENYELPEFCYKSGSCETSLTSLMWRADPNACIG